MKSTESVSSDKIRIDGGTQPRAEINETVVAEYAELLADNVELPPVTLFFDGTEYWLADGFHRYHAHRKNGTADIPADVREGTRRDAVLYSVGANADHGLRRSNADKRRAVLVMLNDKEWGAWTDAKIGFACAVTRRMVTDIRSELSESSSSTASGIPRPPPVPPEVREKFKEIEAAGGRPRHYIDKHGNVSVMDTAKIGRGQKAPQQDGPQQEPGAEPGSDPFWLANLKNNPAPDGHAPDGYSESDFAIESLTARVEELEAENTALHDRIAVNSLPCSEDEKTETATIIADLRKENSMLRAELAGAKATRDDLMVQLAEYKSLAARQKKALQRLRGGASSDAGLSSDGQTHQDVTETTPLSPQYMGADDRTHTHETHEGGGAMNQVPEETQSIEAPAIEPQTNHHTSPKVPDFLKPKPFTEEEQEALLSMLAAQDQRAQNNSESG